MRQCGIRMQAGYPTAVVNMQLLQPNTLTASHTQLHLTCVQLCNVDAPSWMVDVHSRLSKKDCCNDATLLFWLFPAAC